MRVNISYFQIQAEKHSKSLEQQLADAHRKLEEASRDSNEVTSSKSRLQQEVVELRRRLEEADAQLMTTNKVKNTIHSQN